MMYSYPYGMYRPYYSYYNRYRPRSPFPTEGRVWDDEVEDERHDSRQNVGQVQSSKQSHAQGQSHVQKQAHAQCQAHSQKQAHTQCQAQAQRQAHAQCQTQAQAQTQDLPQHEDRCEEKPIFDLFGIRLFSDDLLILAILYFLYSEGVQDPELFIALILLLIS